MAGYAQPGQQGHTLLKNIEIQQAVHDHLAAIKRQGIAIHQNRVDELAERHKLLKRIAAERATADGMAGVPGGSTGFVIRRLKTVKHTYDADPDDEDSRPIVQRVEVWEEEVDTGLLRELREHEKQIAQELGEWSEKAEVQHTGRGGGPMEFVAIDVPAPQRPDEDVS